MLEGRYDDPPTVWDDEDAEPFQKIRRQPRPMLPTSAHRKARRSAKETIGSRRVRKAVSNQGGMHRRRQKKMI